MEHLYNPDQMSEREIKETFVARQALLDRLVGLVRRQPEGAGVQHVVLVAPRGMGKTTMLLMVQFAIADGGPGPASPWLALRFPEELYGVTDLADFWLETLGGLSAASGDGSLAEQVKQIRACYPDSETLSEAALALLRDWCRTHGKRLLLLVDNFQQILGLLDEQQAAALRRVLMNEGFLMILGAAPSFFKEASGYDEPLYNFFRLERLERLRFDDMRALLIQRAVADGLTGFEATLDANTARLRALEYFTDGNVRLVLMLYRVVAQSALLEVREGLDKLLDQVTPFYKAKTEDLPPQQRKILDHIARTSGQSREGASPSEIALATRLSPQVVSAQLKRLAAAGYVHSANLRGRTTSYTLSEPLYSLWYQMRFGRDARQRMAWLVDFLKGFYTAEELGEESRLLGGRFQGLLAEGREHDARNALEHRRWLVEAMPDPMSSVKELESVIQGYLALNDVAGLKEQGLADDRLELLSDETLDLLVEKKCVTPERADQARAARVGSQEAQTAAEVEAACRLGLEALKRNDNNEAMKNFDRALALDANVSIAWTGRAVALCMLDQYEETLNSIDRALTLGGTEVIAWDIRGLALDSLNRHGEAVASYDRLLALDETSAIVWYNRGIALDKMGRYEDAITSYDRALALDQTDMDVWYNRGNSLHDLGRYEEAISSYDRVLAIDKDDADVWRNRGSTLGSLGRYEEEVTSYDQVLALDNTDVRTWYNRGVALNSLRRHEEAVESFDRALALDPHNKDAWRHRASALFGLGRYEEVVNTLDQALALDPHNMIFWHVRGAALNNLDRVEEALDNYDRALTIVAGQDENAESRIRLSKFGVELATGRAAQAAEDWYASAHAGAQQDKWVVYASQLLMNSARQGHGAFVRELIANSHTEDQFFPLARALDYLATGDAALIEKLTPEMRPIVEEVVASLRPAAERAGEAARPPADRRKRAPASKRAL